MCDCSLPWLVSCLTLLHSLHPTGDGYLNVFQAGGMWTLLKSHFTCQRCVNTQTIPERGKYSTLCEDILMFWKSFSKDICLQWNFYKYFIHSAFVLRTWSNICFNNLPNAPSEDANIFWILQSYCLFCRG